MKATAFGVTRHDSWHATLSAGIGREEKSDMGKPHVGETLSGRVIGRWNAEDGKIYPSQADGAIHGAKVQNALKLSTTWNGYAQGTTFFVLEDNTCVLQQAAPQLGEKWSGPLVGFLGMGGQLYPPNSALPPGIHGGKLLRTLTLAEDWHGYPARSTFYIIDGSSNLVSGIAIEPKMHIPGPKWWQILLIVVLIPIALPFIILRRMFNWADRQKVFVGIVWH